MPDMAARNTSAKTKAKSSSPRGGKVARQKVSQPQKTTAPSTTQPLPFFLSARNRIIALAVILIIALLYSLRSFFVVALVNGQPVTRLEFNQELEREAGKQALNSVISKTLVLQEARKKNITVSQKETDGQIKKIESGFSKQGRKLDEELSQSGLKRSDLVEQIRMQLLVEKLLSKEISVSDKEAKDFLERNKDQLPPGTTEQNIKEQLKQQKLRDSFQTWVDKLQKDAKITYFLKF